MANLPLTLETLQSPSNDPVSSMHSPLVSPQYLKVDSSNSNLLLCDIQETSEASYNLTLDTTHQQQKHQQQQQQHQQHSYVTPTSMSLAAHGNISPAPSSGGSLSPSFLPEMPQWKRDLIQRRKQNVQRTISASSPTASTATAALVATATATAADLLSSSTSTITMVGTSYDGLKFATSASSIHSLAGNSTNIDQLASDDSEHTTTITTTKDCNKTSLATFANTATATTTTTATKVNKQQYATTNNSSSTPANITKPAINNQTPSISSPVKEKAEQLFGGQYTATAATETTTITTTAITQFTAKEAISSRERQDNKNEEATEMYRKTKEHTKQCVKREREREQEEQEQQREREQEQEAAKTELNDETQTQTLKAITNKQQMATRLTGSTHTTSLSSSTLSSSSTPSPSLLATTKRVETEREKLQYHHHNSISGANVNFVNQSLNKCESERLVCAGNTAINTINVTGTSSTNCNKTNHSVTIGGVSVSSGSVNQNLNNYNISGGNISGVVKISQKLKENQFIKNEQLQQNTKKFIKFKQNTTSGGNISLDLKSPTKSTTTLITSSASTSCLATAAATLAPSSSSSLASSSAASTASTNCAIKKKMVAVQEMKKSTQNSASHLHPINSTCNDQQQTNRANNRAGVGVGNNSSAADLDSSEDLSYGPGIVSKLRCRYLSLALRESMEQQRLSRDKLRRSTSLNNLLDNTEDEENCDDDEEEDEEEEGGFEGGDENDENNGFVLRKDHPQLVSHTLVNKKTGILKTSINNGQTKRFSHNSQGSNGVGVTFTETTFNKRSRHLKRGNDSLKRARSVEALLSEKSPWQCRGNGSTPTCVTIEEKIHNARERLQQGTDHMPPKRLTSIIDDTERPPPDLVKQTLKMFEASANRRPRSTNRNNTKGEVASKVETFKNIIKEQKPAVTFPKPLSPTKKLNTPSLQKPLKVSTPQATDLLQSPLGRKTLAACATSTNTSTNMNDCLTPLKTNNVLSDHTPDIIPRQKFNTEREFKHNKEVFTSKETVVDVTPISALKREQKEKLEVVDSPLTALTKELSKLKLNDNTPTRKNDNLVSASSAAGIDVGANDSSDNHEIMNNVVGGAGVSGVGGGGDNNGDAYQRYHKHTYNNEFTNEEITSISAQQELNSSSSLKNEHDKIKAKQISNETTTTATTTATATATSLSSSTTIETKNEATVNNYDSLTRKATTSPPPSSSSDLSDGGETNDDHGVLKTTKRITRTALDNIAKAGYTQQFKFNTNNSCTSTPNSNSNNSITSSSSAALTATTTNHSSPLNSGKQIGVIRPLLNTQQQQQQQQQQQTMDTLKHSNVTTSLTSREIEKNRINDLKKSSNNGKTSTSSSSSPLTSLDNVIKSSSASANTTTTSSPAATASGFSDVDSVISATNSPLWAMRKRRQAPPAAPAENTTMVFNFSNRKEVPDYIENDGVIFRRKREMPKPNESGFVLLGDLAVETSTDMDYDDFSMCPPSPCDVEFVNANIVIDGKSSIRQKSKDTTFHVQFNDTLTSTFEYPSEASLIVDDSFSSAYNDGYNQPHGTLSSSSTSSSSANDFTQAFQNLCLENMATHHHVADEIIQLPTINASSPAAHANANNANATPTKNILGNLPLGSAPLGFYTPLKAPIDRLFQLGVTRAPSLLSNDSPTNTTTTATTNCKLFNGGSGSIVGIKDGCGDDGGGSIVGIAGGLLHDDDYDTTTANKHKSRSNVHDEDDEPESLQYIKPADDDLNMAYSEGTQKTDLLY